MLAGGQCFTCNWRSAKGLHLFFLIEERRSQHQGPTDPSFQGA